MTGVEIPSAILYLTLAIGNLIDAVIEELGADPGDPVFQYFWTTPPPAPLDIIRVRVGNYTDPDGKIESAANAIIGAEVLPQGKYRDADMDSKAGKTAYALGSQAAPEA